MEKFEGKPFRMVADIEFIADSIDDAFFQLHRHFYALFYEPDEDGFNFLGEIKIEPVE